MSPPGCYRLPGGGEPGWPEGPAPEHEARFWSLIEAAWAPLGPEVRQARQALVVRPAGSPADTSVVAEALPGFLDVLASHCRGLPGAELTSLDRVLERKLWESTGPMYMP